MDEGGSMVGRISEKGSLDSGVENSGSNGRGRRMIRTRLKNEAGS